MNRVLVWDLLTRIFHGLLTVLLFAAFVIGFGFKDSSPIYPYHKIAGLIVGFMILLRLFWGIMGTRYARFSALILQPKELIAYVRGAFCGTDRRYIAHNPGSSYAIVLMLALPLILALSGVLLDLKPSRDLREIHEVAAGIMVGVVIIHIIGVLWYTIRHKELITIGMLDGRKRGEPSESIASARPFSGILFLALSIIWSGLLLTSYDSQRQTLSIPGFGYSLNLGEHERGHKKHEQSNVEESHFNED